MDDPWGSPWTTTDTDGDIKPPSPAKSTRSDLEPPPRAFFAVSNAPKIPTPLGKSPWADDDDGFGDWAAPGTPAPAQSAWGGGWHAPSPRLATPSRDPDFGSASPIAWPGNIALPKPASSGNLRPPSPDPWSAEFPPPIDESLTPRPVVDSPLPDDPKDGDGLGEEEISHDSAWAAEPTIRTHSAISKPENWPRDELRPERSGPASDGPKPTSIDQSRPGPPSVDVAEQDREPPISPSSGGDSDREDGRPDSPITSIDEDARIRQPIARKVSGKVQVLVERFDGLARAQSEEPPVLRRQPSRATLGADAETPKGSEELQDAGDNAPQGPSAERTPTSRALEPAAPPHSSPVISSPRPRSHPAATSGRGFPDHAPPSFDVNLKLVDELFGQSVSQPGKPPGLGPSADVSECILSDSFTEISERKTWYRVSRIGSSRRHNSGDDENYRLVTWPTSTVRLDTLKVVRRWMEEDSISGRVTLGGGVSKTQKNMFGWDSSAEPMALDAALAKRRGAQRPSSVQTLNDVPGRTFGSLVSPIHRPSSVAIPPVASFSWSSNSPVTPHHTQSPNTIPAPHDAHPPQLDNEASTKPILTQSLPLPVTTPPSQALAENDDDGDDDDWGEMISSPPSTNPPPTGLQSFELALPAGPQAILAPAAPILPSLPTTATSLLQGVLLEPSKEQIQDPGVLAEESSKSFMLPTMPTAVADPWETVDMSASEQQPPPLAAVPSLGEAIDRPAPIVEEPAEYFHHTPLTSSMAATKPGSHIPLPSSDLDVEQDFTPTTPLELNPPLPLPQSEDEGEMAGFQTPESENAVRQIIDNLPDLSYMLR